MLPLWEREACFPRRSMVGPAPVGLPQGANRAAASRRTPKLVAQFKNPAMTRKDSVVGCLLGTAVGDALGLACEGLSKRRQRRLFPEIDGHHFLFGRGMTSDDTEHTCMVAQALIVSAGDADAFAKSLAWRLRFWLLGLPAGIGLATFRAIVKLWLGFPSRSSGVFSAGNGPAMRSAIIGVCYGHDLEKLRQLVRASTRLTHTDPKAEYGALAVALAAYLASKQSEEDVSSQKYLETLQTALTPEAKEFFDLVGKAAESAARRNPAESFAAELGLRAGVSGYVYHTVPIALHAWFRHPTDYRAAVLEVVRCGGDTDTAAAILGGIIGAGLGKEAIPPEWLNSLCEWPRTKAWMEELGQRVSEVSSSGKAQDALALPVLGLLLRNLFFLIVALAHGFRRLLPPY